MDQTRPHKFKSRGKSSADRKNIVCCVCGGEQKDQWEKFRSCSGCKEKIGARRYFCSRACQKTDWKTHREWCGSHDFWDYPHRPLLVAPADFERPAALRCQLALIDADPDVLYTLAPGTDDVVRFTIHDKMLNVSFRRVRDKAFTTCDLEAIAILGQVLAGAVEAEAEGGAIEAEGGNQNLQTQEQMARRIDNVFSQLGAEYDVPAPDIADTVLALMDEQMSNPAGNTRMQCVHQENMTKHPSDFWKALARIDLSD
ncbi:MYND-type domain-containing protein [Mycena venus]|uniref:MYND-type domain-containing protein n=1 Tax=Mycena venus TaxID=2733690 RepID=A0A8H6XII0_9AGAR|nr:MYND-type domain-containing protein [Mycena venus]